MVEVLQAFGHVLVDARGVGYVARACGREMRNGLWEGWLEFLPLDGSPAIHSARETTQPNGRDARYWASGLTGFYLEGALERALEPRRREMPGRPDARSRRLPPAPPDVALVTDRDAVLDPFSIYEQGEAFLRRRLEALSSRHLLGVIEAYGLAGERAGGVGRLPPAALIDIIVEAVVARATSSSRPLAATGRRRPVRG